MDNGAATLLDGRLTAASSEQRSRHEVLAAMAWLAPRQHQVLITPQSSRVISTVEEHGPDWPSLAGKLSPGCCALIHMAR
jgi:hypothetical protein